MYMVWVVQVRSRIPSRISGPRKSHSLGNTFNQSRNPCFTNITYVLLDSFCVRAQTRLIPTPARMDGLTSAIFSPRGTSDSRHYSSFPTIDIYHINDYHGALAPIYLLPKGFPRLSCVAHARISSLWPSRTTARTKRSVLRFNISREHCQKYVQFGNTFNYTSGSFFYQCSSEECWRRWCLGPVQQTQLGARYSCPLDTQAR